MQMHIQNGAKVRDVRLMELLSEKRGEIDVPFIMECMKDHKYWPKVICSHPTFEGDERTYIPTVLQFASMIVDFEENTAYISSGPPCETNILRTSYNHKNRREVKS